jgi:hypothetical protein
MKHIYTLFALLSLTGCGLFQPRVPDSAPAYAVVKPGETPRGLGQNGISVSVLDDMTGAGVAVGATGGRALGLVTVGLGSPTEQGVWLKTNLVQAPMRGRVALASGQSIAVDLLPHAGGALMSFAAYRALGLSLTDLPQVQVFAN